MHGQDKYIQDLYLEFFGTTKKEDARLLQGKLVRLNPISPLLEMAAKWIGRFFKVPPPKADSNPIGPDQERAYAAWEEAYLQIWDSLNKNWATAHSSASLSVPSRHGASKRKLGDPYDSLVSYCRCVVRSACIDQLESKNPKETRLRKWLKLVLSEDKGNSPFDIATDEIVKLKPEKHSVLSIPTMNMAYIQKRHLLRDEPERALRGLAVAKPSVNARLEKATDVEEVVELLLGWIGGGLLVKDIYGAVLKMHSLGIVSVPDDAVNDKTLALDEAVSLEDTMASSLGDSSRYGDPLKIVIANNTNDILTSLIAELSPNHRVALTLREIHGMSYQEIARVMGKSKADVAGYLYWGHRALRKKLTESENAWIVEMIERS